MPSLYCSKSIFAAQCYASAAYAIMRCLSVCPSVRLSRSYILSKRINISSKIFRRRVATPFKFFYTNHHRNFSNAGGVSTRQKSRFWANIWLHHVLLTLRPARWYQHCVAGPWPVVTLIADSKRRSLLMAGEDDEMFKTRSFNVTPKTTEQHWIVGNDLICSLCN